MDSNSRFYWTRMYIYRGSFNHTCKVQISMPPYPVNLFVYPLWWMILQIYSTFNWFFLLSPQKDNSNWIIEVTLHMPQAFKITCRKDKAHTESEWYYLGFWRYLLNHLFGSLWSSFVLYKISNNAIQWP